MQYMLLITANVVRATIRTYRLKQQGRVGSSMTVSPRRASLATLVGWAQRDDIHMIGDMKCDVLDTTVE